MASASGLYERRVSEVAGSPLRPAPACPACAETRARVLFNVEGIASPIVACPGCGLGRFDPPLSADEAKVNL